MNLGKVNTNGRTVSLVWIIVGGLAMILGGIVLSTFTPSLFPTEGSVEAQQVDNLFRFMLAIGGAIFLLVNGVLLFSVLRFRAHPEDISDGPPIQGNTTLEFVWTVIPAVIVAILTLYSYQVWTAIREPKANEMTVHVVGQRFAWTFNYDITADTLPEGVTVDQLPENVRTVLVDENGAATGGNLTFSSPQLHTWVGQPVLTLLDSEDVNHAFWIPAMRIKQDLLPGRETDARFTPLEAGVYRIVCAELCGSGHGDMAGTVGADGSLQGAWVVVHPDEQTYLNEFYAPEAQKVLFPPEDPVDLGHQILASGQYPCATCHTLPSLNWTGALAPNLEGIGTRAETRVSGLSAEQYIHDSIRHPGDYLVDGFANIMPQFNPEPNQPNYMPENDIDAIVAFLLTQ